MGKFALIAASVAALSAAGIAGAEPANVLVVQGGRALADNQRSVGYGDLQLASAADRRVLQERVGLAIADLCDPTHFSVAEPHGSMICTQQAWTDVQSRMGQLTARFASR